MGKGSEVLDLRLKSLAPYTDLFNWVAPSLQLAHETDKFPELKGHCHAIWQLYKKLEGVFASVEFQN